jgi:filamentous hemagglutinin
MRAEGKVVGDKVKYARDPEGNPLPPGQFHLYHLDTCAMGHIIDAVTWWNTNGRFTGPQSTEVQTFMTDPNNYEIEPSGPNSRRGAQLGGRGGRYLPPAK